MGIFTGLRKAGGKLIASFSDGDTIQVASSMGITDGSDPAQGEVGEEIDTGFSGDYEITTTGYEVTQTLQLPPGDWIVTAIGNFNSTGNPNEVKVWALTVQCLTLSISEQVGMSNSSSTTPTALMNLGSAANEFSVSARINTASEVTVDCTQRVVLIVGDRDRIQGRLVARRIR